MSNYEEKENQIIPKIVKTLEKLDDSLERIDMLDEDGKHKMKKWFVEKKALHEIKKILHEANKYDKYDDKELEKAEKEYDFFD